MNVAESATSRHMMATLLLGYDLNELLKLFSSNNYTTYTREKIKKSGLYNKYSTVLYLRHMNGQSNVI